MDRTSRGAALTPEGERVVAELNIAHNALLKAVHGAQVADARLDEVKLLTTDGIAAYWLVRFLPFLFEMHRDLEMRIFTTTDFEAERRGHFDLTIHYTQPTNPNRFVLTGRSVAALVAFGRGQDGARFMIPEDEPSAGVLCCKHGQALPRHFEVPEAFQPQVAAVCILDQDVIQGLDRRR
jgi:DNA-binding transcriptional LysR family regulator